MRIIAGRYRGQRLQAPKGMGTRPTIDRVRESLMSVLASARGGFEGAVVLDAFAGSGALGLEALSRGAASACFFERDGAAARVLQGNIETLGLAGGGRVTGGSQRDDAHAGPQARTCRADVFKKPPTWARPPFDLVLLDPPYATGPAQVLALLDTLDAGGALAAGVLVSYEHDAGSNAAVDAALAASGFSLASRHRYGDTVIDILTRLAEDDGENDAEGEQG